MRDEPRSISGSLKMREPADLVGRWIVETRQQHCTILLASERVESANGWRLTDADGCLAGIVSGAVVWRPAPEGVEFAAADRRTLLVFTAIGDRPIAEATLPGGGTATLRPSA